MSARLRRALAGIGCIAAGLVLALLIRAINRHTQTPNPGNMVEREAGVFVPDASGSLADDADLLARFAPNPDFIVEHRAFGTSCYGTSCMEHRVWNIVHSTRQSSIQQQFTQNLMAHSALIV